MEGGEEFGGVAEALGGDAAFGEAGAAEVAGAVDHVDFESGLGGLHGAFVAAGTCAYDEERGHGEEIGLGG